MQAERPTDDQEMSPTINVVEKPTSKVATSKMPTTCAVEFEVQDIVGFYIDCTNGMSRHVEVNWAPTTVQAHEIQQDSNNYDVVYVEGLDGLSYAYPITHIEHVKEFPSLRRVHWVNTIEPYEVMQEDVGDMVRKYL